MANLQMLLAELHLKTVEELLVRVQSGEASSADLSVARQMLKDNGIDSVPREGSNLAVLSEKLPFADEDEPITKTG